MNCKKCLQPYPADQDNDGYCNYCILPLPQYDLTWPYPTDAEIMRRNFSRNPFELIDSVVIKLWNRYCETLGVYDRRDVYAAYEIAVRLREEIFNPPLGFIVSASNGVTFWYPADQLPALIEDHFTLEYAE